MKWDDVVATLSDSAHSTLDGMPESLLEQDGGPYGVTADIILARLFGLDGEIVKDCWRLDRVQPRLRLPIPMPRRRLFAAADPAADLRLPPIAEYVLQSGWARLFLDPNAVPLPQDVTPGPPDFRVSVLFLRYRRKL